ncbi:uncharacterized protein LOC127706052 isoform X1 [Mytilus californianus]|uniref:uncharacterized protein LOC127706052 isoform X1 n=1 Tax=Mytilus californianus TaxID=6549 RepID=UPI002245F007|nr:uncharacterized protein LOC127706052 isoform X1 [Mytilus californianus]
MAKINRSRITVSANIILTVSLITRTLTFGFIFMSIYIKVKDDILDEEVIKVVDMEVIAGMPLGSTVKSIIFSLIGVFAVELMTGIFGLWGALGRNKRLLAVAVVFSSFMIVVYIIYIVLLSIIYHKKTDLYDTLLNYTTAYKLSLSGYQYISYWNREKTFPEFLQKLGCPNTNPERYYCWSVYVQELGSYLEIYIGIIVTCIVCQICSIVAIEYIFRKLEFKEKKPSISENKYYLLLSLNHGIFRSLIIFIKDHWNRSKIVFASAMLKISSLIAGVGLLGHGLTLIGDVFISDGSLRHIFYKMQFYHYYFYNILVGLAAASVVIGICTSLVAVLGLAGSWRKSQRFLVTSSVLSVALHIPRLIAVVLWIVFIAEINIGMKFQLWLQQLGYFYGGSGNRITGHWNNMIMTLQCCGVNYYSETHTTYGIKFCCKNAHPRILDKEDHNTNSYYELFDYFGGCGGYKTDTCAEVILFKTKMFVGWFLAIVLLQIILEIIGILFANKEYSDIMTTKTTENSTGDEMYTKSVIFRTVFRSIKSFFLSNWKRSKITLVCFISLGIIFICSLVVLCLAINIRYDKVFGNLDIQDIFARINVTDHTFSRAINIFFIVTVTFSSLSIATVILSIIAMISPKWKPVLHFAAAGLLCSVLVANVVQTGLWGKYLAGVSLELENELKAQFVSYAGGYYYSHHSATYDWSLSLSWNALFVQAECCGVGPRIESSFESTYWYIHGDRSVGEKIPVQCCISQSNVFPYSTSRDVRCNSPILEGYFHSKSCDVAVNIRLKIYSTVFIVFMAIIILAEICCVVTTVLNAKRFKQDATILNRSKKPSGENTEMRKDEKTQKEKDNARKERKHGDKKAKGLPRNKKQRSVGTEEIQQKANTIVQENAGENIELQMMKSMEIEDTVNNKPDEPNNKRRQEEDDLAEKDLTMLDN